MGETWQTQRTWCFHFSQKKVKKNLLEKNIEDRREITNKSCKFETFAT